MPQHFIARKLAPVTPPAFFFFNFPAANIHPAREQRFEILLSPFGSSSARIVHIFQPLEENQIAHLLNGSKRIGNSTAPETVPERINLGF
jgi:hypothetical protein